MAFEMPTVAFTLFVVIDRCGPLKSPRGFRAKILATLHGGCRACGFELESVRRGALRGLVPPGSAKLNDAQPRSPVQPAGRGDGT